MKMNKKVPGFFLGLVFVSLIVPVLGRATEPAAIEHRYADVNGVRLHYATAGEGPLILFLHGFPEFWYQWKDQLADFSRDFQAVAPDMRGFNLSSAPSEVSQYRVKTIVEDVRAWRITWEKTNSSWWDTIGAV